MTPASPHPRQLACSKGFGSMTTHEPLSLCLKQRPEQAARSLGNCSSITAALICFSKPPHLILRCWSSVSEVFQAPATAAAAELSSPTVGEEAGAINTAP